mgnify:FL=1
MSVKNITFLFSFLLFYSCSGNEDNLSLKSETDILLVTGIILRDNQGQYNGKLGNPNVFGSNNLSIAPNPVRDRLYISCLDSKCTLSDVWFVPAVAEKVYQLTDFNSLLNSSLYEESQIESNAELTFKNKDKRNMYLNIESLKAGYYKVFVKINGIVYWENIFVHRGGLKFEEMVDFWGMKLAN